MKINEYDDVDPAGVLHLNLLSLGYPLTPELAGRMRLLDPRVFPFFGLYAVEEDVIAGQVLVYRLPVMTVDGPEDVGGVAAVCTHPSYGHRGIAARLLEEAHARMREAGLRISTLATERHRIAYLLYHRDGYCDALGFNSVFASAAFLPGPSGLHAIQVAREQLADLDKLFANIARNRLGFARRHTPFFASMVQLGDFELKDVWLVSRDDLPVGYAVTRLSGKVLSVSELLLDEGVGTPAAISALVHAVHGEYVQVRLNHPGDIPGIPEDVFSAAKPAWGMFMIKPLIPGLTVGNASHLLGIDSDRFLLSALDVT